jgi:hypothetical protein
VSARRDDLIALLAKVKAGEFDYRTYPLMKLPQMDGFWHLVDAYNGDLNAAKALHEAVLPDFSWSVSKHDRAWVIGHADPDDITTWIEESAQSANPARAWLIAILKALIAEAQPTPHPTQEPLI